MRKALTRAGLTLEQIGLVELNEAFAVQSLAVMKELGLRPRDHQRQRRGDCPGSPAGLLGARILTTLLHEMRRRAPSQPRPFYGSGDPVRGRRAGRGDDRRMAGVIFKNIPGQ